MSCRMLTVMLPETAVGDVGCLALVMSACIACLLFVVVVSWDNVHIFEVGVLTTGHLVRTLACILSQLGQVQHSLPRLSHVAYCNFLKM